MVAKKTLEKEKSISRTSLKENDPTKDLEKRESYKCVGNFIEDFTKLCQEKQPCVTPTITQRPTRPAQQQNEQQSSKPQKPQKQRQKCIDILDKDVMRKLGMVVCSPIEEEAAPRTYTTTEINEFMKASLQLESEDNFKSIQAIFARGWLVDATMMDILHCCVSLQSTLHTINLWSVGLNNETLLTLSYIIKDTPSIKTLQLDNNPINEAQWHFLIMPPSKIEHLSLRHNRIGCVEGHKLGHHLGNHFSNQSNNSLISLNLSGNQLGDKGAELLFQGLKFNRSLRVLDVSNNHISDCAVFFLCQILSEFPLNEDEAKLRLHLLSQASSAPKKSQESTDLSLSITSKSVSTSIRSSKTVDESLESVEECEKDKIRDALLAEARFDSCSNTIYIVGNFHVHSINISRNDLHYSGLENLLHVLQFQCSYLQYLRQLEEAKDSQSSEEVEEEEIKKDETRKKKKNENKNNKKNIEKKEEKEKTKEEDTTLTTPHGAGLMRLLVQGNNFDEEDCCWLQQIEEFMKYKDPLYKEEEEKKEKEEKGGNESGISETSNGR